MPFTPIHLGPGAAFKAIGGRHFSFMVFGGAQVLMDIEPLLGILRDWPVLHGYSHTLLGALLIGLVAGLIGRPISERCLVMLKIPHVLFTWGASFAGALVGTYSHIALDAVMHADMHPWWPLSNANPLLDIISIEQLHGLCLAFGALGGAVLALRAWRQRDSAHRG
ncbi:MAG: metal-dependent hydrolase [Tahibacter sp.]